MENYPDKLTAGDYAHSAAKGLLGMVPFAGAVVTEIFSMVITPPLEKRRREWMESVAEKLKQLEENGGIKLNSLSENEGFIDVVLQATSIAIKTSERRKLESLRNAVVNSTTVDSEEIIKRHIFLNQLDKFTTWHIVILEFADNPRRWFEKNNVTPPSLMAGSLFTLVKTAFPYLESREELVNIIWEDLRVAGFHSSGSIKSTMTEAGLYAERTSQLGREFLTFISSNEG